MEVSIKMTDKELRRGRSLKPVKIRKLGINKKRIFLFLLSVAIVTILGFGAYFLYKGYKLTKDIGFQFNPGQLIEKKKDPELRKDSSGTYTNVLIVGIDTRDNTQLLNTDVLIVASYNHKTKDIVMISVPRDFNAQVSPDRYWFNKINSAYSINEKRKKGSGLPVLEEIIEEVVGMEIQYHAMIDFKGFVELIDAVGGVYINVENSFTDYRYPRGKGYQTISFKAGPQLMDGDTALKYARSRHSMNNGEGSDFARARRQQKVIDAFKDVVLSSETFLNPSKIMAIMSSVQSNLKVSEFDLEEVQAGVNILKNLNEEPKSSSYSFVLDPTAGNYSLIKVGGGDGYSISPAEGLGKYTKINEYVQLALTYPRIYSENPSIYIYDTGLGYQDTSKKTQNLKSEFKYLNIRFMGTKYKDKESITLFSNKTDEFTKSVNILAKYLDTEDILKPEYITNRLNGEDISIFFGKEILPEVIDQKDINQ